jgi:SAM-dependent methyltransferase
MTKEWFEDWFDSPYYHKLYHNRDTSEANIFVDNLFNYFGLQKSANILDLACGKGRFSTYIASKGHFVTGLDLSPSSILEANKIATDQLEFYCHDMRHPFRINYFDYVFNFFTSFGYFKDLRDNAKTLRSVYLGLRSGGYFVLDFFNAVDVVEHLVAHELKLVDGVSFELQRRIEKDIVYKHIDFTDQGRSYSFQEAVQLISLSQFQAMFAQAGFKIEATFGDYQLHPFDPGQSKRLIIIAKK